MTPNNTNTTTTEASGAATIIPEVEAIPEDNTQGRSTSIVAEVHDVVALPTVSSPSSALSPSALSAAASFQTVSLGESMDQYDGDSKPRATPTSASASSNPRRRNKKRRPAITSISIFKVTRDDKIGVAFKSINGRLQVSRLLDGDNLLGSKFSKSNMSTNVEIADADASDDDNDDSNNDSNDMVIRPGDNVLSINHVYCALWSPTKATQALKEIVGLITIQLSPPDTNTDNDEDGGNGSDEVVDDCLAQAVVFKSNPNDKLGIAFDKQNGRLRISAIHPNGLLGGANNSALNVGDYLIEIDDVPCAELNPSVAKELITAAGENMMIKLLAVSADDVGNGTATEISSRNILLGLSSGRFAANTTLEQQIPVVADPVMDSENDGEGDSIVPAYISAMVVKPMQSTALGIQLAKRSGGFMVIKNIREGSIISKTPLQIGMIILSINNVACQYMSKEEALTTLRTSIGQIHIVAQNVLSNEANPNYVEAMITKINGPSTRIGVGIKQSVFHGGLEISSINPNGLFVNSVLNTRDIILSVNNNPETKHMTSIEVVTYIAEECPEYVTILAKTSHSTGVVVFSS